MKPKEVGRLVLEGVLLPGSWDASGEILAMSLLTFNEEEYRIDPASADRLGLRDLLRRHVRLSAVVGKASTLEAIRVELLGDEDDPAGCSP